MTNGTDAFNSLDSLADLSSAVGPFAWRIRDWNFSTHTPHKLSMHVLIVRRCRYRRAYRNCAGSAPTRTHRMEGDATVSAMADDRRSQSKWHQISPDDFPHFFLNLFPKSNSADDGRTFIIQTWIGLRWYQPNYSLNGIFLCQLTTPPSISRCVCLFQHFQFQLRKVPKFVRCASLSMYVSFIQKRSQRTHSIRRLNLNKFTFVARENETKTYIDHWHSHTKSLFSSLENLFRFRTKYLRHMRSQMDFRFGFWFAKWFVLWLNDWMSDDTRKQCMQLHTVVWMTMRHETRMKFT